MSLYHLPAVAAAAEQSILLAAVAAAAGAAVRRCRGDVYDAAPTAT